MSEPAPLLGCLICHEEGLLSLSEGRKILGMGGDYELLTCGNCGAVALWDGGDNWRIRYRKIPTQAPYSYAAHQFGRAGWLRSDDALDMSTEVYVHRQRVAQARQGELGWLKPNRLNPPPPLMSADEVVFLSLKPVIYCETNLGGFLSRSRDGTVLDTGTLCITDSKIHLLGRRDRSHRLTEIRGLEQEGENWYIHVDMEENPHHYRGGHGEGFMDAELVIAIIEALRATL